MTCHVLTLKMKEFSYQSCITQRSIIHQQRYHGYRKQEQPNDSVPRDFRLSKLYRGVQLYAHGRKGLTTIPLRKSKGCLMSSNLSLIRLECHMKGSTECPGQVSTIFLAPRVRLLLHLPGVISLASFMDRPVTISYLAYQPICGMWSICVVTQTHISQYTVLNAPRATSFETPHSQQPTPRMIKISKLSSRLSHQGYHPLARSVR